MFWMGIPETIIGRTLVFMCVFGPPQSGLPLGPRGRGLQASIDGDRAYSRFCISRAAPQAPRTHI